MLLVNLNILGVRKVSHSYISLMLAGSSMPPTAPPCSLRMASVGPTLDYLQFVPKSKYPDEDWVYG